MAATLVKALPDAKGQWFKTSDAAALLREKLGNGQDWTSYLKEDRRTSNDGYQQLPCVTLGGPRYYDSETVEAFASHINAGGELYLKPPSPPTGDVELFLQLVEKTLRLKAGYERARAEAHEAADKLKALRAMSASSGASHA